MKITIKFSDGLRGVYSEMGDMLGFYEGKVKLLGKEDGCPWNQGIFDGDKQTVELWGDIVKKLKKGTYKLPKNPYLDNGQITEEGRIKSISIK